MTPIKKTIYIILTVFVNSIFSQEKSKTIIVNIPKFEIPLSESSNINSIYFYKNIEDKLTKQDTTITYEQIISLTKYNISKNNLQTKYLDSLYNVAYKLNEKKKYSKSIEVSRKILKQRTNNISAIKEISFAYKKLGNEKLANSYYSILVKIIKAIFKYGDGSFEHPFLLNNFSEGITIYETAYRCKQNKTVLMLDENQRLLGAYNGYSSEYDEIIISYSELTHSKSELKETEYIIQN